MASSEHRWGRPAVGGRGFEVESELLVRLLSPLLGDLDDGLLQVLGIAAETIARAEGVNEAAWNRYCPGWDVLQGRASAERYYLFAAKLGEPPVRWQEVRRNLTGTNFAPSTRTSSAGDCR
jgi:hypothetical protein